MRYGLLAEDGSLRTQSEDAVEFWKAEEEARADEWAERVFALLVGGFTLREAVAMVSSADVEEE